MAEDAAAWLQAVAIIVASTLAIYYMVKQAREVEELQKRLHSDVKRITVLEYPDGSRQERPYRDGDYVGKRVETERGEAVIAGIYAVRPEPEKEKGKKKGRAGKG